MNSEILWCSGAYTATRSPPSSHQPYTVCTVCPIHVVSSHCYQSRVVINCSQQTYTGSGFLCRSSLFFKCLMSAARQRFAACITTDGPLSQFTSRGGTCTSTHSAHPTGLETMSVIDTDAAFSCFRSSHVICQVDLNSHAVQTPSTLVSCWLTQF